MSSEKLIHELTMLNQIADTLNGAADARAVLDGALAQLVQLMGLQAGWIFLKQPEKHEAWHGRGYTLAAHYNLPPALALDSKEAWDGGCDCQGLCYKGKLTQAYNEVRCSRLAGSLGDRHGLSVHASVPLRCCDDVLGILNVAASDWSAFTPEMLALLGNAGTMMGVALQRAQLFDLLKERHVNEQAALLDFSSQLLSRLDLDDIACYVVAEGRRMVNADACALLLTDHDSPGDLVFHAAVGWSDDPAAARRRIPADASTGPGRVIQTQQPLVVPDLPQVEWAAQLPPWLLAEGFHGHAIIPLVAGTRSIGALLVDMCAPHRFDDDAVRFLRLIGNQAALALEKARLHEEALRQERLERELDVARQIQLSLLPRNVPQLPGWSFAAVYCAARQVSGDFYDFIPLQQGDCGALGIVIADVADKGIPAALYMALARTILRAAAISGRSPASALARTNEIITRDSQADTFLTAFYARLDVQTGQLCYANAGHNRPLWLKAASGELRELATAGIVLGTFAQITLPEDQICAEPGDVLVFYTDGITEATSANGEFFDDDRLRELIQRHRGDDAPQIAQAITAAVTAFTSAAPQHDDFTLLVVKRL